MTDSSRWLDAFFGALKQSEVAEPLKQAALAGRLADWTRQLTTVIVRSGEVMRWRFAAKGHALELLPKIGQEYLGIDLMAFKGVVKADAAFVSRWQFPVAVFELENSRDKDRVAYSLWKILCIRTGLRVAFAYRGDWEQGRNLLKHLTDQVIGVMPIDERMAVEGETLMVLGSHGEGETFPHGYFKVWRLDTNIGRFTKV